MIAYVTMNVQKDGRVLLGTGWHCYLTCPAIVGRAYYCVYGRMRADMPVCAKCAAKHDKDPFATQINGLLTPRTKKHDKNRKAR